MKPIKQPEAGVTKAVEAILPEIHSLIEEARHRAVTAANLAMVTLYWNIGRVISTEVQSAPGRAGYGEALLTRLGDRLNTEYGRGFSRANLQDMRRFHDIFEIYQPVASKLVVPAIRQPAAGKSLSLASVAAKSGERLLVDFARHYHLGWTHYRILLGIGDARQRRFYFEQACNERWSRRELQRQIAGALFERVALSSDTRALVRLEKQKGPPEVAHYQEAFKTRQSFTLNIGDIIKEAE